jgi:hypothetical protein
MIVFVVVFFNSKEKTIIENIKYDVIWRDLPTFEWHFANYSCHLI